MRNVITSQSIRPSRSRHIQSFTIVSSRQNNSNSPISIAVAYSPTAHAPLQTPGPYFPSPYHLAFSHSKRRNTRIGYMHGNGPEALWCGKSCTHIVGLGSGKQNAGRAWNGEVAGSVSGNCWVGNVCGTMPVDVGVTRMMLEALGREIFPRCRSVSWAEVRY
jgi:hypothetical protein